MQIGVAIVDQAVRVSFGAVVALTRLDIFIYAIHQYGSSTFEDVDKFTISGVCMLADRSSAM